SSYTNYFTKLEAKIKKYNIKPKNIYNIDKKGFIIGVLSKARRIFIKQALLSS
ncbi:uncharacterized protein MYCFIDRAFT_130761, partial [Pseudocercospora fijiensis CIRAD86]